MINSLIVDDESKGVSVLQRLLTQHCPEINIIGIANRINEAIELIELHRPQLLFLDIAMPGGSGFDLLEKIQQRDFHVIFVTARSEFAIKAFRFSVTDYLLKPLDWELLKQAVMKVKNMIEESPPFSIMQTLRIPTNKGVAFVPITNIVRMAAEGSYTHIYLDNGSYYLCSNYLKQFEEYLDEKLFIRLHRSHIINLARIKSVVDKQGLLMIEMSDGGIIEVPRRNKQEILDVLNLKK